MANPNDVFDFLPRPADEVGSAVAPAVVEPEPVFADPAKVVPREPEPERLPGRVRHSDRGPKPPNRGASERELASVRGEIAGLRRAVERLPDLIQLVQILVDRSQLLQDRMDWIEDRLNRLAVAPAVVEPEPVFADPAKAVPLSTERFKQAVDAWNRRLIRNHDPFIPDQVSAVLTALAGDDPPSLDLRRNVAAASVFIYACHLSGAYPNKMAAEDVERLDHEITQAVPDVTLLTEIEYAYFLNKGIKER